MYSKKLLLVIRGNIRPERLPPALPYLLRCSSSGTKCRRASAARSSCPATEQRPGQEAHSHQLNVDSTDSKGQRSQDEVVQRWSSVPAIMHALCGAGAGKDRRSRTV